jgi:hypothetical protein
VHDDKVLALVVGGHVVRPSTGAPSQHEIDRHRVIFRMEPVADLPSITIDRQWQILEGVGDEKRDQLFRVLAGTDRIGASGDDDVRSV